MSGYKGYIHIAKIYNILVIVIGLLIVTLFTAISIIPFKDTVRLKGKISDKTVEIRALRGGTVQSINFAEGDRVNAEQIFEEQ